MKKIVLLSVIAIALLLGQDRPPQDLQNGYKLIEKGKYEEAEKILSKWAQNPGDYQSSAKFLLAKSLYRQENYDESYVNCLEIISEFPHGEYFDDALYLAGKNAYQKKEYGAATKYWITVLENSSDTELRKTASANVADALDDLLSPQEIKTLRFQMTGAVAQAILSIRVAKNEIANQQYAYAKQILENFIKNYPDDKYVGIAEQMLEDISSHFTGTKKIATLLPMTGYNEEIGVALSKGIQFAKFETGNGIDLDLYDQNQSMLKVLSTVEQVSNQPGTLGLIGPVDNETTAAVGMLSKYTDLPILTPTAGEVGLSGLSSGLFQLSPDYSIIASKLANYAINQLNLKTFAILAPLDEKGMGLAEAFRKTVEEDSGTVLIEEYYYSDADSYKEQFLRIRRQAIYLVARDTVLKNYPEFSQVQVDSFLKAEQENYYEEHPDEEPDSLEIKIENIDGLFIPIYPSDLKKMAAQFAFYNIKTTLIGNDGWINKDYMVKNQVYFKEALFCTGFYLDEGSWDFKNFRNRYRVKMQETPGFYETLGYDVGKFVFEAAKNAENRAEFISNLSTNNPYQGLSMTIRFGDEPRVNSHVKIVKFKMGQFLNVE